MNFDFPEFACHPFCRNSHLQTVLSLFVPSKFHPPPGEMRQVKTEDDDTIIVHENTPTNWKRGDRIALLIHGLCGSHRSGYMARVCAKLIHQGIKTIRIDMRGFGESEQISRGHMHAGRSDDVHSVLTDARIRFPGSPMTLIGFSLGANIALKRLCEYHQSPPIELDSAVVVAPPIDLLRCTLNLQKGLNRFYDRYFTRLLSETLMRRRKSGRPLEDIPLRHLPKRLHDFDDQYTAPAAGFVDAAEYYAKCSTHRRLDSVTVPTLLLAANDDPIVPVQMYDSVHSPAISKLITKGGGHLGFLGKATRDPDRRWMDWRIVDWVTEIDRSKRKQPMPSDRWSV